MNLGQLGLDTRTVPKGDSCRERKNTPTECGTEVEVASH